MNNEVIKADLELLTHKYISGDITPVVFDILKDSPHLDRLIRSLGGKVPKVVVEQSPFATPSFSELFSQGINID